MGKVYKKPQLHNDINNGRWWEIVYVCHESEKSTYQVDVGNIATWIPDSVSGYVFNYDEVTLGGMVYITIKAKEDNYGE